MFVLWGVGLVVWTGAQRHGKPQRPNPWSGIDTVREHSLLVVRGVFTIDDRGDGSLYALLEMPDGAWYLLIDEELPDEQEDLLQILSRTGVYWVSTLDGRAIRLWSEGERVPTRGVRDDTDEAVDEAIDAGFCWSPDGIGPVFSRDELPPWVTDWEVEPPPGLPQ